MTWKFKKNSGLSRFNTVLRLFVWLPVCLTLIGGACQPQPGAVSTHQASQTAGSPSLQPTQTVASSGQTPPSPTAAALAQKPTATVTATSSSISLATKTPTHELILATTNTPTSTPPQPTATSAATATSIIPVEGGENYPGLSEAQTGETYPGEAGGIFNAGGQVNPTLAPTPTRTGGTQAPTPTVTPSPLSLQQPTATRLPTQASGAGYMPLEIPTGSENPSLVIWHSLELAQADVLTDIIHVYQAAYPLVSVTVTYVPQDELRQRYESAVYLGGAPDILLGPSDWGAELYDQVLAADLSSYFGKEFWQTIVAPALATGQYHQAQVSLPYAMYGVVMYRNRKIIPQAPASVEALLQSAKQATRGGIVGAYLDLSANYSMAHLLGMGGAWLDESGKPLFDRQGYASALRWMDLLKVLQGAGAVEMNTSRDVNLFQQGKVGMIIDGTWNLAGLGQSVGQENLAVDAWPTYGSGRLTGFVQAQSLYLNPATAARQDANLAAALQFMAAMLSPQVQRRLSETGQIPVQMTIQPADPLIRQAHLALQSGVAFPPALQGETRTAYWTAIDNAIRQVFALEGNQPATPLEALKAAFKDITSRLAR